MSILKRITNKTPPPPTPQTTTRTINTNRRENAAYTGALDTTATVGTIYSIVNRTSTAVADANWHLYRKRKPGDDPDAERQEILAHPALELLNRPNDFFTRQELMETCQQHVDLTGEAYWAFTFVGTIPVQIWPVRPDRMTPKRDPSAFLAGWEYRIGRDTVDLDPREIMQVRIPSPCDMYRGLGPVASLLAVSAGLDAAIRWNTVFFQNSAQPGGIIEVDKNLGDDEFDQLSNRWRTQHRGVSNAERVAILENGMHWKDAGISQKDMDFINGIALSRELIMEAFGISKTMLGMSEDVNRATAETAILQFARYQVVPRLNRWRAALNNDFLPLFGAAGANLEFDYDPVIPDDDENAVALLTARAAAFAAFLDAGVDESWAAEQCGLPEPAMKEKEPVPPQLAPPPPGVAPPTEPATTTDGKPAAAWIRRMHAATAPEGDTAPSDDDVREDLQAHQADWEHALEAILAAWAGIKAAQVADLTAAARDAATRGAAALAAITCGDHGGPATLASAMRALWTKTAEAEAAQMRAYGEDFAHVTPPDPPAKIDDWAKATADILTNNLQSAARSRAVQAAEGTPETVADAVHDAIDTPPTGVVQAELGGALTRAQGSARIETMALGPTPAYYAKAILDINTCENCEHENGKWLGNTLEAVATVYPAGQYIDCLGGPRCRCQVVATYRNGKKDESYEKRPVPSEQIGSE